MERAARADPRSAGEPRKRGGRSRGAAIRVVALVSAAGVVVIAGLVGVAPSGPSATETVKSFLLDWESGDYTAAAALTTGDPGTVTRSLEAAYSELGAADLVLSMRPITVHGDSALAFFGASVDLGRGGMPWEYQGHFTLRRVGTAWRVVWSPAVIAPGLGVGDRLAVLTTVPPRAQLLDAAGQPLLRRSPAYRLGVVPDELRHPGLTASALAQATDLGSESQEMLGQILAAPSDSFLELVQLAPARYQRLRGVLAKVPGLDVRPVIARIFRSTAPAITGVVGTETARVLIEDGEPYRPGTTVGLSGLEQAFQRDLAGTPTTEVVVQNAAGRRVAVLKRWPGRAGTAVRTTIEAGIQQAAQQAVDASGRSAAIVAVRAGSGQILAVATHGESGTPMVSPLAGRYQPGQTFMMVSTAALFASAPGFSSNALIQCNPTNSAGGQTFANVPAAPYLGAQPKFSVDFANACSTAFAGLSLRLTPGDLSHAARNFGIGLPWRLQLPAFAGLMRSSATSAQLAADTIGIAAALQVSPLDMALAAGLVDSGSWHPPLLVTSPPDPGLQPRAPYSDMIIGQLKHLMWATVKSGAGRAASLPGAAVFGQVGAAALAGHHGLQTIWFVGFRGNVAFAVVVFSPTSAFSPAVRIARQFAAALPMRG
ncbi:MAG TPA: penicillin-binding transpeptidase domain-containing protein [Streptosporangiaceae bacterium]|nr:penicillin-binding transpeptidase domain-containing protein [Streptosporangiaceae bacterium]